MELQLFLASQAWQFLAAASLPVVEAVLQASEVVSLAGEEEEPLVLLHHSSTAVQDLCRAEPVYATRHSQRAEKTQMRPPHRSVRGLAAALSAATRERGLAMSAACLLLAPP